MNDFRGAGPPRLLAHFELDGNIRGAETSLSTAARTVCFEVAAMVGE